VLLALSGSALALPTWVASTLCSCSGGCILPVAHIPRDGSRNL